MGRRHLRYVLACLAVLAAPAAWGQGASFGVPPSAPLNYPVTKTANYTLTPGDNGKTFDLQGGSMFTLTAPAASTMPAFFQAVLQNNEIETGVAPFIGSISGTTLTVVAPVPSGSDSLAVGQTITWNGGSDTIASLGTGTGGAGTYTLNSSHSAFPSATATCTGKVDNGAGASGFDLTVTSCSVGAAAIGQYVAGTNVTAGSIIYDGTGPYKVEQKSLTVSETLTMTPVATMVASVGAPARGKQISVNGVASCVLWPGQTTTLRKQGGSAWQFGGCPRWQVPKSGALLTGHVEFFTDPANGADSTTNDGLMPWAGAFASLNYAQAVVMIGQVDAGPGFQINGGSGSPYLRATVADLQSDTSNVHVSTHGAQVAGGNGISFEGGVVSKLAGNSVGVLQCHLHCIIFVSNLIFEPASALKCIEPEFEGMVHLEGNNIFRNCYIQIDNQGWLYWNNNNTWDGTVGSPAFLLHVTNNGVYNWAGTGTMEFASNMATTTLFYANGNSTLGFSGQVINQNGYTITGRSYDIPASGSLLIGNTVFPGSFTADQPSLAGQVAYQKCIGAQDGTTTTTCTITLVPNAAIIELDAVAQGGAGGNGASLAGAASGGGSGGGGAGAHFTKLLLASDLPANTTTGTITLPPAHLGGAASATNPLMTVSFNGLQVVKLGGGGDGVNGVSGAAAGGGGGGGVSAGGVGTAAAGTAGLGGSAGGVGTPATATSGGGAPGGSGASGTGAAAQGGSSLGSPSGGGGGAGCNAGVAGNGGASGATTSFAAVAHDTNGSNDPSGGATGGGGGTSSATNSGATAGGNAGNPGGGGGGGGSLCNSATGTPGVGKPGGYGQVIVVQR